MSSWDWGAHAPSRAGDCALAIANFSRYIGEGAEMNTRGACAPQITPTQTVYASTPKAFGGWIVNIYWQHAFGSLFQELASIAETF